MCSQVYLGIILGVILAISQNGYALQCWTCNSQYDVTCRDHFNATRIRQNAGRIDNVVYENNRQQPIRTEPHLRQCDEMYTASYSNKNVCLKWITKASSGPPIVRRECRLVPSSLKLGDCPDDVKTHDTEFCGTCDTNECNEATGIKINILLTSVIPAILVLIWRK